jgi:hypothetical protein
MRRSIPLLLAAMTFSAPVRAGIAKEDIFGGSVGALFTIGGDLWTEPDHPGVSFDGVPFGDTAGGLGVGGGVFFQARFIKYIGLEIGLLFEHDYQWYDIEYNDVTDLRYHLRYTLVRIPILVQGVLDTPTVRVSLGIGPEIALSRGARTDVTLESGPAGDLESLKARFKARNQNDVMLAVALGFAFKVWKLSIPFDIRYAYNLTQPDGHEERLDMSPSSMSLVASHSMDLRLMAGVAYDF